MCQLQAFPTQQQGAFPTRQAVGKSQPWKNNTPKPNKAKKPQARSAQGVF